MQLPKEHTAELDQKDGQIADLERMIAKLERRVQGLVQLKANNGIQAVVDDKDKLIAELSTRFDQLNQENLDIRARYQAVAETAAWQEERLDIAKSRKIAIASVQLWLKMSCIDCGTKWPGVIRRFATPQNGQTGIHGKWAA